MQCDSGKLIHETESAARKFLRRTKRNDRMRVYHCRFCGYFHLTKTQRDVTTKKNVYKRDKRLRVETRNPDNYLSHTT